MPQITLSILRPRRARAARLSVACAVLAAAALPALAVTVIKNNTATVSQSATDWSAAPLATDVGQFDATLSAANAAALNLTENVTLGGLVFTNALNGPVSLGSTGGFALTLGVSGIDMAAANQNVTINSAVVLNGTQTWSIAAARTLEIGGPISGSGSLTKSGGRLIFSGTQANTYTGPTTLSGTASLLLQKTAGVNAIAGDINATANGANIELGASDQIADTATINLSNGAKFQLNGFNETVAAITGSGTSLVQATESASGRVSTLTINATASSSFSGILRNSSSGTGNLLAIVKTGAATVTFSSTAGMSFSGGMTVSEGRLVLGATGNGFTVTAWNSSISNAAELELRHDNSAATTAESLKAGVVISGSGVVLKTGVGRINILGTSHTYSGVTVLAAGALNVAGLSDYGVNGSLGNRAADADDDVGILFQGGTLQYTGATATSTNRAIRIGAAGAFLEASGSTTAGTMSFTGTGSPDLFEGSIAAGGTRGLTLTGTNTGTNSFNLKLSDESADVRTVLNKTGAGTWYITNTDNSFGGVTTFIGGILNVASLANYGVDSSLGNRASDSAAGDKVGLLFRGGTLQYTGATAQSTNRQIRISTTGGATIDASGSNPAATLSFTAASSADLYENAGARTLTLTGTNTGDNTFGIKLTDQQATTGRTTLIKTGSGTWVLSHGTVDPNTYTGDTLINEGTLAVAGGGAIANGSNVVLANTAGAFFQLNANETIGALSGGGTSGGGVKLQDKALTLGGGNFGGTFAGVISSTPLATATPNKLSSLIKTGTGTQYLTSTDSTYVGFTELNGGILNVAKIGNLGEDSSIGNRPADNSASDVGLIFRGGTLQYTGSTAQSTNRAIRVSINNAVTGTNVADAVNGGAFIDASGSNIDATLSFTRASSPDFFESSGNRQITFTGTNEGNNTFAMAIAQTGGVTHVNKTGAGLWRLSGTSSYTGNTTVSGGALLVTGSLAATNVSVAAGATLGGSGTIGNSTASTVTVLGTLSPGSDAKSSLNGVSTLTFGSATAVSFGVDSFFSVQIGSALDVAGSLNGTSDRIALNSSSLTLGSNVTLNGTFNGTAADVSAHTYYWIATLSGAATASGTFANSTLYDWSAILGGGYSYNSDSYRVNIGGQDFALFYNADFAAKTFAGGNDLLLVAVVPEPGRCVLLLAGLLGLAGRRRR